MEFRFEVGRDEIHSILFSYNIQLGIIIISVDNKPVIKESIAANMSDKHSFEFTIGENEKHSVRILLRTEWPGPFQAPNHYCEVFIDGNFYMKY